MCGIAGYFGTRMHAASASRQMLAALAARGPDASGSVFWDRGLARTQSPAPNALLHTRLSIIDPRPEADQPMANADGSVWLSYNGEVYDWAADASTLEAAGYHFRTRSDTEFILHAYEHWGIEFVARLRGMFAIALFDQRRHALYLIRDRLGLKPVIYAQREDGIAFASTVRALLPALPRESRAFSDEGIDAYLAHRTIPAPRTIFKGVSRLPPAHYLTYMLDTGTLALHEYWKPEASPAPWLETLDDAIRMRTVADRPLGLLLSSGIDSGVIACRLRALGYASSQTFTAAFPHSANDESADARAVAQRLGFSNLSVPMPTQLGDDFDRVVADLDEPFADPSSFPTWALSRETTRHVKVVLAGDGGDELLGGYKRYAKHLRTRWRRGVVLPRIAGAGTLADGTWPRIADELGCDWRSSYVLRFSGLLPRERRFIAPDMRPRAHYWRMPDPGGKDDMAVLTEIDRLNYLPDYILRKSDLCTMAHGLELRAPLLDHRFVETVLGLPGTLRFTTIPKKLFMEALTPIADLQHFAKKKRGFNPPLSNWLRKDLATRLPDLGSRLSRVTSGQLSAKNVDAMVALWRREGARLDEQILQLVILDESLRQLDALRAA
jgi:asparagine synthase (glutamine-hydrolysing)